MSVAIPHFDGRTVLRISWVPRNALIALDALADFRLRHFQHAALRALQRALPSDAIFVGGLDVSLNVQDNVTQAWQVHVYGLVGLEVGTDASAVKKALRRLPIGDVPRPLKLGIIKNPDLRRLISYSLKSQFYRRSGYWGIRAATGKPMRKTRAQELRGARKLQLALMLDQFPIGQRLLLVGLRRVGPTLEFDLNATACLSSPTRSP